MSFSNRSLIEASYEHLDLKRGKLFTLDNSQGLSEDDFLGVGGWIDLAREVGATGVFFHEENPIIIFSKSNTSDSTTLNRIYNRVWSMSRPKFLFLEIGDILKVYDLGEAPSYDGDWALRKALVIVSSIIEIKEKLKLFNYENIITGKLFEEAHFGEYGFRPDTTLLQDLQVARTSLRTSGLDLETAHALISRSIFIRYLEDRSIITKRYFVEIAGANKKWLRILDTEVANNANPNTQSIYYTKVLLDYGFAYAFFKQLSIDFKGDIFSDVESEREITQPEHLLLLQQLLTSNLHPQQKIFLWAYDFKIVPIELISSIYEEFYHSSSSNRDEKGTHYTPHALAEFVLNRILTKEQLEKSPKILDPACGSAIFLVEAFKRIVRYRTYHKGKRLTARELRSILRDQILGIEVNSEAIKVAAFSLYLALLHYQDPPDIIQQIKKGYKLPNLILNTSKAPDQDLDFNILICENAFKETNVNGILALNGQIDIIVGNPPWGSPSKKDKGGITLMAPAIEWCKEHDYPIGDIERSQMFIWRSLSFLRNNGLCGLLVSTGVFFKTHKNSEEFRKKWLNEVTLIEVINFVQVRDIFFANPKTKKKAISPFASVF